jgi:hypothetical protein
MMADFWAHNGRINVCAESRGVGVFGDWDEDLDVVGC